MIRRGVQLDRPPGRYAYGNQPRIALWNLTRLAECLLPLLDGEETAAKERWRLRAALPGGLFCGLRRRSAC